MRFWPPRGPEQQGTLLLQNIDHRVPEFRKVAITRRTIGRDPADDWPRSARSAAGRQPISSQKSFPPSASANSSGRQFDQLRSLERSLDDRAIKQRGLVVG